ncbi:MAG: hypothetical protein ABL857_01705, partial [Rickettsiales bacterium]
MRLRTFTAPDIPSAMRLVRETLGENAIILATDAKAGSKIVSVTAAIEEDEEEPAFKPIMPSKTADKNPEIDDIKFELQNILRFHNLPEIFVAKLLQKFTNSDILKIIENRR